MSTTLPAYLPRPVGLTDTGELRAVVEKSSMINNDEYCFRIPAGTEEKFSAWVENQGWKIMTIRPLFQEELDAGLTSKDCYSIWDETVKHPSLTNALDAFYRLREYLEVTTGKIGMSLEDALLRDLAYQYYDCLSGGCSIYALVFYARMFRALGTDLTKKIYPSKDTWHTVGSFLAEMEGREDLPDTSFLALGAPSDDGK